MPFQYYRYNLCSNIRLFRVFVHWNFDTPKTDWSFKLDPRKGESASEVHFGMSTTF